MYHRGIVIVIGLALFPRTAATASNAKQTHAPTAVSGYTVGHKRVGVQLEFGYPFAGLELALGLGSRFQFIAGYRGLYSFTNAGYGGFKVGVVSNTRRTVGLAFSLIGGYTHNRGGPLAVAMVGGDGVFGEMIWSLTARRRRHGVFINAGFRLSQVTEPNRCQEGDRTDCIFHFECLSDEKALATVYGEIGWEYRFAKHGSYFLALGFDAFIDTYWLSAAPRLRTGFLIDF